MLCRLSYWVRSKKFCAEYEIKSYDIMAGTAGFAFAAARAAFRIQGFKICHNGRDGWIRTSECRRQRPMPYRLATPPYSFARNSVTLKITRCVRSASQGYMGWVKGLEPSTLGTTIRCSNQLSYTHHIKFAADGNGTPGGIRTPGLLLRRQLLYPAELLAHINSDKPIRRKWSG